MNRKRLLLALSSGAVAVTLIPMFAAFEAHVINVTAKIENALAVSTDAIDFGTVFPQEHLEKPLEVRLSGSFMEEERVDDVEYFIRQKPKCAVTSNNGTNMLDFPTATGHIKLEQGVVRVDCGPAPEGIPEGAVWGVLPSLCPYISKEDDQTPDNDGSLASFHQPWTFDVGTTTINWNDTLGRLAKSERDIVDNWTIDLAVPCFGGHCAQDWEDFVEKINPDAVAADYVQPIENEHKIFGCDLWVEVSGVSLSHDEPEPTTGTLNIVKVLINDDGGNQTNEEDFSFTVNGGAPTAFEADGTNSIVLAAGTYDVAEVLESGYTTTYANSMNADVDCQDLIVPAGGSVTCTITNNDNEVDSTTLTVTKTVTNDNGGTLAIANFPLFIDGNPVVSGVPMNVTAGAHIVSETGQTGYQPTIGGDCAANGSVNVAAGADLVCTITNNDISPSITLTKVLANNANGPIQNVAAFNLTINGIPISSGGTLQVNAGVGHVINETVDPDYDAAVSGDVKCPAAVGGSTAVLGLAENISCTITNTFDGNDDNQ